MEKQNKHHSPGLYPMYHIERILDRVINSNVSVVEYEKRHVEMSHLDEINVGDTIQYKNHDLVMQVIEVIESRKAKGDHKSNDAKWSKLILEYGTKQTIKQ